MLQYRDQQIVDHQQEDQRRQVEPAERRQNAADRTQDRRGHPVQHIDDHINAAIAGVHDAERHQPAGDDLRDDDPNHKLQDHDQQMHEKTDDIHTASANNGSRTLSLGGEPRKIGGFSVAIHRWLDWVSIVRFCDISTIQDRWKEIQGRANDIEASFRSHELNRLRLLVIEHRVAFLEAWHAHFGN